MRQETFGGLFELQLKEKKTKRRITRKRRPSMNVKGARKRGWQVALVPIVRESKKRGKNEAPEGGSLGGGEGTRR